MAGNNRESNEGFGALFPTREKRSDKSPDYTGRAKLGGVNYVIAAWEETARSNGMRYLNMKFTTEEEDQRRREQNPRSASGSTSTPKGAPPEAPWPNDDDIPF